MTNKQKIRSILKDYEDYGRSKDITLAEFTRWIDNITEMYFPEITCVGAIEGSDQSKIGQAQ